MKTAERRSLELCNEKFLNIPEIAYEYIKYLLSKHGRCGEIFLKAFSHYAQIIEGLPCEDLVMEIDDEAKKWFQNYKEKK